MITAQQEIVTKEVAFVTNSDGFREWLQDAVGATIYKLGQARLLKGLRQSDPEYQHLTVAIERQLCFAAMDQCAAHLAQLEEDFPRLKKEATEP